MIALDSNVLVRFLVEDDAAQSRRAREILQAAGESFCYISDVALCEVVWVLGAAYKIPRADIAHQLGELLRARQLSLRSKDQIATALAAFRAGRGDFADYMIREEARAAGCTSVATFDKALLRDEGFQAAGT